MTLTDRSDEVVYCVPLTVQFRRSAIGLPNNSIRWSQLKRKFGRFECSDGQLGDIYFASTGSTFNRECYFRKCDFPNFMIDLN